MNVIKQFEKENKKYEFYKTEINDGLIKSISGFRPKTNSNTKKLLRKAYQHQVWKQSEHMYKVLSISGTEYEVLLNGSKYSCTCPFYESKTGICSHVLAVILYEAKL